MNKKERTPIRPSIKTLWIGDHQIEEFFVPHKETMERQMDGEIKFISNPQEALGILEKKAENGSLPDILVIKSYMSGMNGLELIRAVKSHQNSRVSLLPICVLAGYLEESEKAQLEELGIKIFNLALIKENLHQIRRAWEESQEKEPNPRQIRVLWVDDEALERVKPNELLLKGLYGKIEYVLSGKKALEILERKARDEILPNLVISDFNMPGMNGLEFVEAVRSHEDERIRFLPICIVSGLVPVADEKKLGELGIPVFDFEDAFHEPHKIRQVYEESKSSD